VAGAPALSTADDDAVLPLRLDQALVDGVQGPVTAGSYQARSALHVHAPLGTAARKGTASERSAKVTNPSQRGIVM
jgi:hypothetical protein